MQDRQYQRRHLNLKEQTEPSPLSSLSDRLLIALTHVVCDIIVIVTVPSESRVLFKIGHLALLTQASTYPEAKKLGVGILRAAVKVSVGRSIDWH